LQDSPASVAPELTRLQAVSNASCSSLSKPSALKEDAENEPVQSQDKSFLQAVKPNTATATTMNNFFMVFLVFKVYNNKSKIATLA
jgi:hypothetical protein